MQTVHTNKELINTIQSLEHILTVAMEDKFSLLFKKKQFNFTPEKNSYGHAYCFAFSTSYKNRQGVALLLYKATNYVYVFSRELTDRCDLKMVPHNNWKFMGYHDSCWRDCVRQFVRQYSHKIKTMRYIEFGEKMKMTKEMYEFMNNSKNKKRGSQ